MRFVPEGVGEFAAGLYNELAQTVKDTCHEEIALEVIAFINRAKWYTMEIRN